MQERVHEVSRLEGFSDAVFGFALTLLVVSLEPPRTSDDLVQLVRGSVPFALMFAMVCYIWWEHNKFFRRYGLQDAWTAFINSALLFVVLFYVYPLKFLTVSVVGPVFGVRDSPQIDDGRFVMIVYSAGVVLIFGGLALLYRHAWNRRVALALSAADEVTLWFGGRAHLLTMAIGVLSIVLAIRLGTGPWSFISGTVYFLMAPAHTWNGFRHRKAMERLSGEPSVKTA